MEVEATIDELVRRVSASLAHEGDANEARDIATRFADAPGLAPHIVAAAHRAARAHRSGARFRAACYLLYDPVETLAIDELIGLRSDPDAGPRTRSSLQAFAADARVTPAQIAVLFNQVGHAGFVPGRDLDTAVAHRLEGVADRIGELAPGPQGARTSAAYADELVAQANENVFTIASELAANVFALPADVRIRAARVALDLPHLLGRSAALVWLADRDPTVREAVANAAATTAANGRLDGASRRRVETLARWTPASDRAALERVIAGFDHAGIAATPAKPHRIRRVYLTPVGGAGTARVLFDSITGGAWSVSGLPTHETQGLMGGWRQPVTSRGEVDRLLAEQNPHGEAQPVDYVLARTFLAERLAAGQAAGHAPAFDALEVAEVAGLMDLQPAAAGTNARYNDLATEIGDDHRAATDVETALEASADWPDGIRSIASWRPEASRLPDVGSIDPDNLPDWLIDSCVQGCREAWADRLLWLSRATRGGDPDGDWPQFVRVAGALLSHRPMSEIPLARQLVADTVRALEGVDHRNDPRTDTETGV
jgi:hypothetical protein